eukprot:GFKZ01008005.1.p1 GENE.GFKZ01008005.1~~GFKZ01008005.1.p1  ORF type:complete len:372 (+),score=42.87 GFKZ01008005.1:605-1720(+)
MPPSHPLFLPPPPLPHTASHPPRTAHTEQQTTATCSSSTPCVVALTTAAVLALGSIHPRLLTPKARRTAMPMAVTAALVGGLTRPRRHNDGVKKRSIAIAYDDMLDRTAPKPTTELESEGGGAVGAGSVYSYAFNQSRRNSNQERNEQKVDQGTSGVFGYLRDEFESEEVEGGAGEWEVGTGVNNQTTAHWDGSREEWEGGGQASVRERGAGREDGRRGGGSPDGGVPDGGVGDTPGVVSVASVVRGVLRGPMWVLREVVVPAVEVVWWAWYDVKVWLMAWGKEGRERYFGPEIRGTGKGLGGAEGGACGREGSAWERGERAADDVWGRADSLLTEEERQLREVGRVMRRGVRSVEGGVKWVLREFWDASR